MAFTALTSAQVASGKPVTTTLMDTTRTNLDDHESRIATLEASLGTPYPIEMAVAGPYTHFGAETGVVFTRIPYAMNVTGTKLIIQIAGGSGTTEVDVLYKRGAGSWTSLFSTKPSVGYASGDYAVSSNAVLTSTPVALQAGDLLRLDISTAQGVSANGFLVQVEHERA